MISLADGGITAVQSCTLVIHSCLMTRYNEVDLWYAHACWQYKLAGLTHPLIPLDD